MGFAEVRAIKDTDFDIWLPLWKDYQRFYEVEIEEPVTLVTWARFFDTSEPVYAAMAMAGGHPLGLVHWIYHRSTWTVEDNCYLQDLFVSPDARGGGVGRALIEHVYEDAKRRGGSRLYWLTHETNYAARRLYDKVADRPGFIQYRAQIT